MKDLVHPCYADIKDLLEQWSPDEYYKYIFQFPLEMFQTRVDMAGFKGAGKILDAGCGYGQWAVALAGCNGHVTGIDLYPGMVKIGQSLAERFAVRNVEFQQGDLNQPLPFADEEFDLVWCWSVIMFVRLERAMPEFNRVLKPGGRLLLGAVNSRGRWLYKLLQALNPLAFNKLTCQMCWKALRHGSAFDAFPSYMTRKNATAFYDHYGFELVAADCDGHIDMTGQGRRLPMFAPSFMGLDNNIEYIGTKVRTLARRNETSSPLAIAS